MTVFKNCYACLLLKISASRYPSRNLRVTFASAGFLTKLGIVYFTGLWKRLETSRNVALSVASFLTTIWNTFDPFLPLKHCHCNLSNIQPTSNGLTLDLS